MSKTLAYLIASAALIALGRAAAAPPEPPRAEAAQAVAVPVEMRPVARPVQAPSGH